MQHPNIQPYKGLSNIGATCYMNSLLQTLYMTPQFRNLIYQWQYNPQIHPKQSDCIIYQLQKLFAKLQTNFPAQVSTRQLAKSFQWMDQQVLQQQDIQQFNRVLFQALQKSFNISNNNQHKPINTSEEQNTISKQPQNLSLKNLYDGSFLNYTKCDVCGYESARQQLFQDVILTIKNIYEKIYNGSTQLALQRYLKPEKLDGDNLYHCQQCNTKVVAERGVKFFKMPKLLNVILQRFSFDYFTLQRTKINDYHEFSFVLNFNHYMHGYQQIPNKLNEDSSAFFNKPSTNKKTSTYSNGVTSGMKKVMAKKTSKGPNIVGKLKTKPLAETKTFLKDIRAKKTRAYDQGENDDLIFVSGTTQQTPQQHSQPQIPLELNLKKKSQQTIQAPSDKKMSKSDEINIINSIELRIEQQSIKQQSDQTKMVQENNFSTKQSLEKTLESEEIKVCKGLPPPPPPIGLTLPPPISQPYKRLNPSINDTQKTKNITLDQQLQVYLQKKQELEQQKQLRLQQLNLKNTQKVQQYLKDGPLVYQLYAVMIHSGGATHGHYHSYIKSFQDNKWYCFNDERVSQVNVLEINKAYGGNGTVSNAYALYYRMVEEHDPHWNRVNSHKSTSNGTVIPNHHQYSITKFPECINTALKTQLDLLKVRQKEKLLNLQNIIILKISYQLYVKQLQISKNSTLQLCLQKAMQMFSIDPTIVRISNYRLRMFNPVTDTKLDTYSGRENESLQNLKIGSYKNLLLQVKKDEEVFEQFLVGCISLRLVLWEEVVGKQVQSLEENYLKLHKVSVNRFCNMKQVQQDISKRRIQILEEQNRQCNQQQAIAIVKRHQNDEYSYHEVVNVPGYLQKTLDDVMINQNEILYIEVNSDVLNWPREFQNQIYRINVKYNLPDGDKSQTFNQMTDSRITLLQLKQKICKTINESPDQIIIKRGNKSGMELKNTSLSLKEHRFINGTPLYLQRGIAAKQGQTRIQLYFAKDAPVEIINRLHQFQYIADIPINGCWKASQTKNMFVNAIQKLKGITLDKDKFRIRQLVSDKIGKIYRERPMKEQQLIQKRQMAIQMVQDKVQDIKDFSIYIKEWNPTTWQLSPKQQLIVNKNTTMLDISNMLHQIGMMVDCPSEKILICRILSIHKFSMLDLVQLQYFPMEDLPVIGEPMFVNADGLLFIVKSMEADPRDLTKEEEKKFGGTVNLKVNCKARTRQAPNKKQKAMKIKVVQKQLKSNQQKQELPENIN